ncbi:MAG: type II toxin-antitoxin system VapC family toxin [Verrucomicrobia bacterium]|nr:type II toxin-antitoxin system VapC family toxin [Verrucomicrobiota bacterium]MDA1065982.1 type II toxin-antitoxin system VapC family toxin [Verrucomicrobiota bacterium]
MIAVDTNVVVRFLTADDAQQAKKSRTLFKDNEVWLSRTVFLETEWVLRGAYKLDRKSVNKALATLSQMEGVQVENISQVTEALTLHQSGWDFADALHVVSCPPEVTDFFSFDRRLTKMKWGALRLGMP